MTTTHTPRPSGKTPAGKAISARNATTHGLFCRQTVLPHLGEDPAGYQRLLDTLHEQIRPRNLMETQYLELWADASWKMRRLSRLEAQVWEDDAADEDALLVRLERLHRLHGGLRRQMDRAVRMLLRDVPGLFERRAREDVVAGLGLTESQCAQEPYRARDVERSVQANRRWPSPPDDLLPSLDNDAPQPPAPDPAEAEAAPPQGAHEICQNELLATPDEDAPDETTPLSRRAQRRQRLQEGEGLLNSGTLTEKERRAIPLSEELPDCPPSSGHVTVHK